MEGLELIDAQFDRAVEIVQALPKTGPIQTDYEEKLTMYSLYKQATVGNVKSARPAMWDMLARAKWDAWAKHRDLEPHQAKQLYVDALLKVLRKYSDKTVARDLVRELESYGGDPSNPVMSRTLSRTGSSDSSGSTVSDEDDVSPTSFGNEHTASQQFSRYSHVEASGHDGGDEQESVPEESSAPVVPERSIQLSHRPQSSLSSHRYRTPLAGSVAISTSSRGIPSMQPLPGFETPSAFAEESPGSVPSAIYPSTSSYVTQYSASSRGGIRSPPHVSSYPVYRTQAGSVPVQPYGMPLPRAPLQPSASARPALETAVENVQAHLAALSERLDSLESLSLHPSRSHVSLSPRAVASPGGAHTRGSPTERGNSLDWDINDLGMWSLVLNPISSGLAQFKEFARFFARNENRSPALLIFRRLCLDVSFFLCVLALVRTLWRKSGTRRGEVHNALKVLYHAIVGHKRTRTLVDRGV